MIRTASVTLLAALLLAGCASTRPAERPAGGAGPTGAAAGMTGMAGATTAKPSATALMVCGDDIRDKVRQVLALPASPAVTDGFAAGRYTCTYRVPPGPLVLSVQQSASDPAALAYFRAQQAALRGRPLAGLGEAAFGTGTGTVEVVKDNETLIVDATGMPVVFGSQQQRRADLAYEIASDVLGCWTGDE